MPQPLRTEEDKSESWLSSQSREHAYKVGSFMFPRLCGSVQPQPIAITWHEAEAAQATGTVRTDGELVQSCDIPPTLTSQKGIFCTRQSRWHKSSAASQQTSVPLSGRKLQLAQSPALGAGYTGHSWAQHGAVCLWMPVDPVASIYRALPVLLALSEPDLLKSQDQHPCCCNKLRHVRYHHTTTRGGIAGDST